jgi:hypothetical protein
MPDANTGVDDQTPTPPSPFTTEGATEKKKGDEDPRQGLPPTVEVVTGDGPLPLDTTKRSDPKGRYVQYNGVGLVRQLTPKDWKDANVDSENTYEWNYLNHKRLPLSIFSDAELQYLLRIDGRFELVEVKEDEKSSETTK